VNYADERFRLMEDLPLWLKITGSGVPLNFMNSITVKYRFAESISNTTTKFINIDFIQHQLYVYRTVILPELSFKDVINIYDNLLNTYEKLIIAKITDNKPNALSYFFYKIVCLLRPIWYKSQYEKIITYFKVSGKKNV